jgi:bacterioferritin (cytochrome b1)
MAATRSGELEQTSSRDHLTDYLNEDLAREYQAINSYVIYSQILRARNT